MINDRCSTCVHNLNKSNLDCELYCYGATETEVDDAGVYFVTACEDYEEETD